MKSYKKMIQTMILSNHYRMSVSCNFCLEFPVKSPECNKSSFTWTLYMQILPGYLPDFGCCDDVSLACSQVSRTSALQDVVCTHPWWTIPLSSVRETIYISWCVKTPLYTSSYISLRHWSLTLKFVWQAPASGRKCIMFQFISISGCKKNQVCYQNA